MLDFSTDVQCAYKCASVMLKVWHIHLWDVMHAHLSAVLLVLIADTTCMCDSAKQYRTLQAIIVFLHIMVKAANLY